MNKLPNIAERLILYQNANSSPVAIKRNFVVRKAEFHRIIDTLMSKEADDPLQHELILGWRGSGKSTLLRRIQIEIDENQRLQEKYLAINLAEEQNAIYRLSDLWFNVLEELMIRLEHPLSLTTFDQFDSDQAYSRYLFGNINTLLVAHGKKAVLLIDNIDQIFDNLTDNGHLLREMLINYNNLQIIGGSTVINEHFWKNDLPFFHFFRIHRLESLSFEEIHELLNHWSTEMQLPQLMDYALKNRGKVEAMRILTNGLPRALQIFIQLLLHDSDLYGFEFLNKVMDEATPLYQERLRNLTGQHRLVVQELAFHWEAAPVKTLVEKCRLESKLISAVLKKLDNDHVVEAIRTSNKNNLYRLADRFFNIWLIFTQGNPNQKREAKYLTIFLENWYNQEELHTLSQAHLSTLQNKKTTYDKALPLSKGLAQSRYLSIQDRDALIEHTTALAPESIYNTQLPRKGEDIVEDVFIAYQKGDFKSGLTKIKELENEGTGMKFVIEAIGLAGTGNNKKAEQKLTEARNKKHPATLTMIADLRRQQGKLQECEQLYQEAIELGDDSTYVELGKLYTYLNRMTEAEAAFLAAIERNQEEAFFRLAYLYHTQNRNEEAEKYYLLAIEAGDKAAHINLSLLYYLTNCKPQAALEQAQLHWQHNQDTTYYENIVILEIWNGIFEDVDNKLDQALGYIHEGLDGEFLLTELLVHGQKHSVLSLFASEKHGAMLKERYLLFYYTAKILAGQTEDNLLLRIPPELMPTVEDMIDKIKEKQAFYAQPPRKAF